MSAKFDDLIPLLGKYLFQKSKIATKDVGMACRRSRHALMLAYSGNVRRHNDNCILTSLAYMLQAVHTNGDLFSV